MNQSLRSASRQIVEDIFHAGLAAVHGHRCVADYLARHPDGKQIHLVAIGKAASAMSKGALQVLGEHITRGLVISKTGHIDIQLQHHKRLQCRVGGHPLPNGDSLAAGAALCQFLDDAPADAEFLFLLSGGASSLVEILADGVSLDDLVRANRWLLGSGLNIAAINNVRHALSLIKGGGLIAKLEGRAARVLLISDVAGDDIAVIGSGLLYSGMQDEITNELPGWLEDFVRRADSRPGMSTRIHHQIIATIDMALSAATDYCRKLSLPATVMDWRLGGDAETAGRKIITQLKSAPEGVYLWGGETTMILPEVPGRGGRNQHLALAAAHEMSDDDTVVLLAAGTDGTDGPTGFCGAIIDSGTINKGRASGLEPSNALRQADAGTFLGASGDLLATGPTGTNVMDLVIVYKIHGLH